MDTTETPTAPTAETKVVFANIQFMDGGVRFFAFAPPVNGDSVLTAFEADVVEENIAEVDPNRPVLIFTHAIATIEVVPGFNLKVV